MIEIKECPVCHSSHISFEFNCKDHSISGEVFQVLRCNSCTLLITSPQPDVDELSQYYKSENYISHSDTSRGIINQLYHWVRFLTLRNKINLIKCFFKQANLLDIGSGAGHFLFSCKKNGMVARGVEPDKKTRLKSIQQFQIEVFEEEILDTMSPDQFEVITMWHVLEHVSELNKRIAQVHRLLKKNGIVILALPNYTSYDAQYYAECWAGYDVPRHLWHFSPDAINKLMQHHGFVLNKILPMYYDAYYVSLLSEKYKKTSLAMINGIVHGFISNWKAYWNRQPRYSSQIYIFKKETTTQ